MKDTLKDKCLENFYNKINNLVLEIKSSDANIAKKRNRINQILNEFSQNTNDILHNNNLSKNKGLSDFIAQINTQISASINSWENVYKKILDASTLRDNFKDSFILIIYGKVKAGKSTLANFIAEHSNAKPEFFRYDVKTGKLKDLQNEHLKVDDLECTDCIQGFKIPGLTVIDTPGLHSLTKANEELAKKYIGAADAVLYPMSSDSVCRHSEMKELLELIEMGKSFFLVLTKSDNTEDDEIDGVFVEKIVNLSDDRRENIENYTRKEVAAKLNTKGNEGLLGDVISVSVKMAMDSNAGTHEWTKSNIPHFYEMLSKNLQPQSKVNTVEQLFASTLASMISPKNNNSLYKVLNNVTKFKKFVLTKSEELFELERNLTNTCKIQTRSKIARIFAETSTQQSGYERAEKMVATVNETVSEELGKKVKTLLENLANGVENSIPSFTLNDSSLGRILEIKNKKKRIRISNERLTAGIGSTACGSLGAWGGAEIGAAVGSIFPGAGTIIGGIAGGIGGAILGSIFGKTTGRACSRTTFKNVIIGNNYEEVMNNAIEKSAEIIDQHVHKSLKEIQKNLLKPIIETMNLIELEINKAITEIKTEVEKLKISK